MAACILLQAAVAVVPAIKASLRPLAEGAEMDEDEDNDDDEDDDEDEDEDEEEDEEELAAVTAQRTAEFAAAVRKAKVRLCTCIDSMLQCRHGGCNGSF